MKSATVYAMSFLVLLHMALIIFLDAPLPGEAEALWLNGYLNLESWSTAATTAFWVSLLTTAGGALIATMAWMKTEFPIYATIAIVGFISAIGPYLALYSSLNSFTTSAAGSASLTPDITIMAPFFLPIAMAWVFIILEFARGRD